MPVNRWPVGTFVRSSDPSRTVYYLGRDYTATVVKTDLSLGNTLGFVHYLSSLNSIFIPGIPGYTQIDGCALWVNKYVREGHRA